jgi:hypothetical protein
MCEGYVNFSFFYFPIAQTLFSGMAVLMQNGRNKKGRGAYRFGLRGEARETP